MGECAEMRRSAQECAGMRRSAQECAGVRSSAQECAGVRRSAQECAGVRRSAQECALLYFFFFLAYTKFSYLHLLIFKVSSLLLSQDFQTLKQSPSNVFTLNYDNKTQF